MYVHLRVRIMKFLFSVVNSANIHIRLCGKIVLNRIRSCSPTVNTTYICNRLDEFQSNAALYIKFIRQILGVLINKISQETTVNENDYITAGAVIDFIHMDIVKIWVIFTDKYVGRRLLHYLCTN